MSEQPRHRQKALDLVAAMFALEAPFGEMLAVIAHQSITILADPGARAPYHLRAIEANLFVASNPDGMPAAEVSERNLFHRSPKPITAKGSVVNDVAIADIDAVMRETEARCDKVRAQRRVLAPLQESVVVSDISTEYLHV